MPKAQRKNAASDYAFMRAWLDELGDRLCLEARKQGIGVSAITVHYFAKDEEAATRPCLHVYMNPALLSLAKHDPQTIADLLLDFAELPERMLAGFRITPGAMNDRPCARTITGTTLAWGRPSTGVH